MSGLLESKLTFLGNDSYFLIKAAGSEGLSVPFKYTLDFITTKENVGAEKIIGSEVSFSISDLHEKDMNPLRYMHGIVTDFISNPTANNIRCVRGDSIYTTYTIILRPAICIMQRASACRIFHKKSQTVMDVVEWLLNHHKIAFENNVKAPLKWEYCTQYNETDFNFFSRLLAEAGIYYYFKQEKDQPHKIVLSNQVKDYLEKTPVTSAKNTLNQRCIYSFQQHYQFYAAEMAVGNANLENNTDCIYNNKNISASFAAKGNSNSKKFNYGVPLNVSSDLDVIEALVDREIASSYVAQVKSNYGSLQAGSKVEFEGKAYENLADKTQVITSFGFEAIDMRVIRDSEGTLYYGNYWSAIPAKNCYRPARAPKPNPGYLQLAIVADSQGKTEGVQQPVFCDKYGRHSVKFLWEQQVQNNPPTHKYDYPWVRILHQWDNGNYRVGTPVVVAFIDGDIDKPMIVGASNDTKTLPLGEFSAENSESSLLKRYPGADSTKGKNYNSIMIKDKSDKEQFDIFAGKDMTVVINKGNRATTLKEGNDTYSVEKGTRMLTIKGDEKHDNKAKYEHIVEGDYILTVKGKLTFAVTGDIEYKSNGNVIIKGSEIKLN